MGLRLGQFFLSFVLMFHVEHRIKSVMKPSAQSPEVLHHSNELQEFEFRVMLFINSNTVYGSNVKLVIWILFNTGARVNEVLNLKSSDISDDWFIRIKGSKGSNNRIIKIPPPPFPILINKTIPYYLFQEFSRFYIYRVCRANNLILKVEGMKHYSVTHSFRHYYASQLLRFQDEENTSGRVLGHKSNKSILHYDKKKR